MLQEILASMDLGELGFNGHPPLGVNATGKKYRDHSERDMPFQWAPTLGGECYHIFSFWCPAGYRFCFNGHPPLGVNATWDVVGPQAIPMSFNGHPPLGVNATVDAERDIAQQPQVSMGTHPWG